MQTPELLDQKPKPPATPPPSYQPKSQTAMAKYDYEKNFESQYGSMVTDLLGDKYGITPKELMVSFMNVIKRNPSLREVSPASVIGAFLTCAEIGLKPNTPSGHCYIYKFGSQAQFVIGYQGVVELAYRNKRISSLYAEIVFQDEVDEGMFVEERGTSAKLFHKPKRNREVSSPIYGVYAVCRLKDNDEPIYAFLDAKQLKQIQKNSPGGASNGSAYNNGTDVAYWMQKKAAIKQLAKVIPKGYDNSLDVALKIDSILEAGGKFKGRADGSIEISQPDLKEESRIKDVFEESRYEQEFPDYNSMTA